MGKPDHKRRLSNFNAMKERLDTALRSSSAVAIMDAILDTELNPEQTKETIRPYVEAMPRLDLRDEGFDLPDAKGSVGPVARALREAGKPGGTEKRMEALGPHVAEAKSMLGDGHPAVDEEDRNSLYHAFGIDPHLGLALLDGMDEGRVKGAGAYAARKTRPLGQLIQRYKPEGTSGNPVHEWLVKKFEGTNVILKAVRRGHVYPVAEEGRIIEALKGYGAGEPPIAGGLGGGEPEGDGSNWNYIGFGEALSRTRGGLSKGTRDYIKQRLMDDGVAEKNPDARGLRVRFHELDGLKTRIRKYIEDSKDGVNRTTDYISLSAAIIRVEDTRNFRGAKDWAFEHCSDLIEPSGRGHRMSEVDFETFKRRYRNDHPPMHRTESRTRKEETEAKKNSGGGYRGCMSFDALIEMYGLDAKRDRVMQNLMEKDLFSQIAPGVFGVYNTQMPDVKKVLRRYGARP